MRSHKTQPACHSTISRRIPPGTFQGAPSAPVRSLTSGPTIGYNSVSVRWEVPPPTRLSRSGFTRVSERVVARATRPTKTVYAALALPGAVALISILAVSASADSLPGEVHVHRSGTTGAVTFIEPTHGDFIPVNTQVAGAVTTPLDFLHQYGGLMGITSAENQLVKRKRFSCNLGQSHTLYGQVHEGVPVFSGMVTVHQDEHGRVVTANGHFRRIKAGMDTRPTITPAQAIASAAGQLEWTAFEVARADLVVVDPGWYGDTPTGAQLAYHLELEAPDGRAREAFFVDAHFGEVIDQWSDLPTILEREIFDGADGAELPGMRGRFEGEPPSDGHVDVDRAYDYAGDYYDYLLRAFDRDSVDGLGLPLRLTVNSTYGGCPNARWDDGRNHAIFCDGLVHDDIVAHELTHGLIHYTGDMIYQNQPGQLNESYADVFGELVDMFNGDTAFLLDGGGESWPAHPTGPGFDEPNLARTGCIERDSEFESVRWLIAEEAAVLSRSPLRDMWSPQCYGHPHHANSDLNTCSATDNGGVHSGSGIPNHAFAMLTDGATFNGHTIRGIGPIKAGAVWYRALNLYLSVASDFEDAYVGLNRAAGDLVGHFPNDPRTGLPSEEVFTVDDARQVDLALQAVEMNTPGRCGWTIAILADNAPPPCPNRLVVYRNDFEQDAEGWTVSHESLDGPRTPYDWVMSDSLPFERAGRAWFCDDPNIGDCEAQDETATHRLTSPPITLPAGGATMLAFTHYVETEPGWDGGLVSTRVNGFRWRVVPSSAFVFNPYNSVLRSWLSQSRNPLGGHEGWTGVGGKWGTSRIDLSAIAGGGDTIEIRFEFGKDGCVGLRGWYVDDVEVYQCFDCNRNGITDDRDLRFTESSPVMYGLGPEHTPEYRLRRPPVAGEDVIVAAVGMGDFSSVDEYLRLELNDVVVGYLFAVGAQDCSTTSNAERITVSAELFNELTEDRDAVFHMISSENVNAERCRDPSYVRLFIDYVTDEPDENENGVLDSCERCARAAAPEPVETAIANRYLAITPPRTDETVAIRVVLADLPAPYAAYTGAAYWVGAPIPMTVAGVDTTRRYVAPLSPTPVFGAWNDVVRLDVYGPAIVPGGVYRIESVRAWGDAFSCSASAIASDLPDSITLETARWGDVAGPGGPGSIDSVADYRDIATAVAVFIDPTAIDDILRADLFPNTPDQLIDMRDVAMIIAAATGGGYPLEGPNNFR